MVAESQLESVLASDSCADSCLGGDGAPCCRSAECGGTDRVGNTGPWELEQLRKEASSEEVDPQAVAVDVAIYPCAPIVSVPLVPSAALATPNSRDHPK